CNSILEEALLWHPNRPFPGRKSARLGKNSFCAYAFRREVSVFQGKSISTDLFCREVSLF
ncbi:MAG: hypothetical protein J6023_07310, partial [Clostridia bacterium]|nr:hypothetical protein [Clostridia bacterium]